MATTDGAGHLDDHDLALALLTKLHTSGRLGLNEEQLRGPTFRGSFPYVLRQAAMRAGLDDLFLALVNNLDASDADHLWAFSFLEDLPAAILALKTTSPSYQSFLERCSGTPFPFFLQKMARFQLVIRAAHGFRSGVAYVTWVRSREEDTDADMDAHLADSGESPTTFLLRRLRTRYLDNALPITVYRLGIFGSVEAIPALETVWTQYDDSDLRALTDEAIGRIRRRIETSRG